MQRKRIWVLPCLILWLALLPAVAQDAYFTNGGVKLHYLVQGKGEPVILVHGYAANIAMNWGAVMPGLSQSYRVIALDNRGHGQSDKPATPDQYGINFVDDVIALMDHLNIKKAHVVGYSMGGFITDKLLVTHPDRLVTATLGGAGWMRTDDDRAGFEALAQSLEQGKGLGPLFVFLTPKGETPPTEERIQQINQMMLSFNDPKALAAVARSFPALAVTEEQLRANKVPALAIIGANDPLKDGVDKLEGVMSNLKVTVIDGANHMTAFASPTFLSSLKKFLAEHPAEGAKKAAAAGSK